MGATASASLGPSRRGSPDGPSRKVFARKPEDPRFHQKDDDDRIGGRDGEVGEDPPPTLPGPPVLGEEILQAPVHEKKAQNVGDPVSQDHGGKKELLGDEAGEGPEGVGDRYVHEEVVPPGDWGEEEARRGYEPPPCPPHLDLGAGYLYGRGFWSFISNLLRVLISFHDDHLAYQKQPSLDVGDKTSDLEM